MKMHEREGSRLRLVEVGTYLMVPPSGVLSSIESEKKALSARHVLDRKGVEVVTFGPAGLLRNNENRADRMFGHAWPFWHDRTVQHSGILINPRAVEEALLQIRPHGIRHHEPSSGFYSLPIISASPTYDSRKTLPFQDMMIHANLEKDPSLVLKLAKLLATKVKFFNGYNKSYVEELISRFDGWSVNSTDTGAFWTREFPDLGKLGEPDVIYNGVDTDEFTPEGPRLSQWDDDKKTIFFAGRFDPRKNISGLIKAFSELKKLRESRGRNDVKLMIAGEGKEEKSLKQLVIELGLSDDATFLGKLKLNDSNSPIDLVRAYRSADLFVSFANGGEGFGITLIEAMASGTPVIASNIEGYRKVLEAVPSGIGVESENQEELVKKMDEVLCLDDKEREALGLEGCFGVRREFSLDATANRLVRHLEKVIKCHGGLPSNADWENAREEYEKKNGKKEDLLLFLILKEDKIYLLYVKS